MSQIKRSQKSLYKIKHFVVEDDIFQNNVRNRIQGWQLIKEGLTPTFWWENVVKPEIKALALSREKEINMKRRRKLAALQLRLTYHLRNLRKCAPENFVECVSNLDIVKAEM